MAFRADAAPPVHRPLAEDVEIAVAAGEMSVVTVGFRELPRHCQLAERAQQRVILQIGGDMRACT